MNYFEVVSVKQKHGRTVYPNCKVESPGDHLARDLFVAVCVLFLVWCLWKVNPRPDFWLPGWRMGRGGVEERSSWWELPAVLLSLSPHPSFQAFWPGFICLRCGLASERPGADNFPRGAKELKGRSSPSASRLVPLGKWEQGWEGCGLRD